MKTMTYTMPLISVVFGFTLPAGLGLYWATSALVRCVQQLAVNKYLSKKSVEDIIAENQKKEHQRNQRSRILREKRRSIKHASCLRMQNPEVSLQRQIWSAGTTAVRQLRCLRKRQKRTNPVKRKTAERKNSCRPIADAFVTSVHEKGRNRDER